jgi:hypothetical protein
VRITSGIFGPPIEVGYSDYTYDANGNNTQDVTYAIDPNTMQMKKQSTTTYTFDSKKSPYRALARILLSPAFLGPNNIVTQTTIDHSNNNEQSVTTNVYEYNSEGYPVKATSTTDSEPADVSTVEYLCK